MKVISIINQKGGIGKTTTAVNLSACLSELGKRVLLIDMDSQANASMGLNIEPDGLERTVYDVLVNNELRISDALCPSELARLDVLPAHMDLAGCEVQLARDASRPYRLRNSLQQVNGRYDYIIIDCPPSLGVLSLNALLASTDMIIPTEAKYYATKGLDMLNKMVVAIYKRLGHRINLMGVLITMYEPNTPLNRVFYEELHSIFGKKIFATLIPRSQTISEAELYRKPVIRYAANSNGAIHYRHLAIEVLSHE